MHDDRRLGLSAAPSRWRPTPAHFYVGLAILTLSLAGLSLLAPSTPSYDPWSWLVWGREIIHGRLVITDTGTSWKPLPMLFTVPFALLGRSAAPELWLVVARAGALAAVLLAGHLAYRLTRALDTVPPESEPARSRAPAVLAGLIAIVGLGFAAKAATSPPTASATPRRLPPRCCSSRSNATSTVVPGRRSCWGSWSL